LAPSKYPRVKSVFLHALVANARTCAFRTGRGHCSSTCVLAGVADVRGATCVRSAVLPSRNALVPRKARVAGCPRSRASVPDISSAGAILGGFDAAKNHCSEGEGGWATTGVLFTDAALVWAEVPREAAIVRLLSLRGWKIVQGRDRDRRQTRELCGC
jgi:hypothetical protein